MLSEKEIINDYIKTIKSIVNNTNDCPYIRGYANALQNVLKLNDNDWIKLIRRDE